MAFAGRHEDINSMCLTAVANLLEKYGVDPRDVGRLEVGTETLVDKSKSTKTHLMGLLGDNTSVEGVTTLNACYGGTAALFNAVDWIESRAWDGRYAVVVAGDNAVYEPGPARPTGGAGVVALLVGPDAPLALEPGLRATHVEDAYDFYKPTLASEYPRVDGHLSNECYLRALDTCYARYAAKFQSAAHGPNGGAAFDLARDADHALFHLPYAKLVQKSFARLVFNEFRRGGGDVASFPPDAAHPLAPWADTPWAETYGDRELDKAAAGVASEAHAAKVAPGTAFGRNVGNMYAGSLYGGLLGAVAHHGEGLLGQRLLMFSYGSGLVASMFSLVARESGAGSVAEIQAVADVHARLEARTEVTADEYTATLAACEAHVTASDFALPADAFEREAAPGTFYLRGVDALERRSYGRTPPALSASATGGQAHGAAQAAAPLAARGLHTLAPPAGGKRAFHTAAMSALRAARRLL